MFHWQSQNATTPTTKRGRELIGHEPLGIPVHLFVRDRELDARNSAPFRYMGRVRYEPHEGSAPMDIAWRLLDRSNVRFARSRQRAQSPHRILYWV